MIAVDLEVPVSSSNDFDSYGLKSIDVKPRQQTSWRVFVSPSNDLRGRLSVKGKLPLYLSIYLSLYLSIYLSISLSIYLSLSLSVSVSKG